jgi:hypothetical protein
MTLLVGDFALSKALLDDVDQMATSFNNPTFSVRTSLMRLQGTHPVLHRQSIDRELISLAPAVAVAPRYVRAHFSYIQALTHFSAGNASRTRVGAAIVRAVRSIVFLSGEMAALLPEIHCELNELDQAYLKAGGHTGQCPVAAVQSMR